MSVDVKITFEGFDQIAESLRKLGPEVAQKALRPSVRKEVVKWRDGVKALAPETHEPYKRSRKGRSVTVQPGTLKRSIRVVKLRQAKEVQADQAAYGIRIAKRAFYWRFSEFGTSRQRARPFIRPVFDREARDSMQAVGDNAREWLRRYWRRMSRAK